MATCRRSNLNGDILKSSKVSSEMVAIQYDMHGNVWEWVQDCYKNAYFDAPTNGSALEWAGCKYRVLRGGSWLYYAVDIRSAARNRQPPGIRNRHYNLGFRLVQD